MTRTCEKLLEVVKQQVNEEKRLRPYTKMTLKEHKEMYFWILAGVHQSALFLLSLDEYYLFKEEAAKIEGKDKQKIEDLTKSQEMQMTFF